MTLQQQITWYRQLLEKCKSEVANKGLQYEHGNGVVTTNPDIETAMKISKMLLALEKASPKKPKKIKAKGPQLDLD